MKLSNHAAIVTDYFKKSAEKPAEKSAEKFDENMDVLSAGKTLSEVIKSASRSQLKNEKMYSHQWRIGKNLLKIIECKLLENINYIDTAEDFEKLLRVVESISKNTKGMGELTSYDIAYRISIFKNTPPKYIYLHAGVRVAVKALGLSAFKKVTVQELSSVFPTEKFILPTGEFDIPHLENCLCNYKDDIAKVAQLKLQH